MKIRVDSDEYRSWHEVGHATVCLYLGGSVRIIELLEGHARGHAVTRCTVPPEFERIVACGGFAAEYYLVNNGLAEQGDDDQRNISRVLFHNATDDREDFWERTLGTDEAFSEAEDKEFMRHAIGLDGLGGLIPLFKQHLSGMQDLVRELCDKRRVDGRRVRELLRIGISR